MDVIIETASDGNEAVTAVTRFAYDLVLMDMRMPEMDGVTATRVIRGLPNGAGKVPIVAVTANAFEEDIKACRDAGMDGFVTKPLRRIALIEEMLRVLEVKASKEQPSTSGHAIVVAAPAPGGLVPLRGQLDRAVPITTGLISPVSSVVHAEYKSALEKPLISTSVLKDFASRRQMARVLATIDIFTKELDGRIVSQKALVEREDTKGLQFIAHTLAGGGHLLGAERVVALSRLIERQLKQTGVFDAGPARELLAAMEQTSTVLHTLRNEEALHAFLASVQVRPVQSDYLGVHYHA